MYMKRPGRKPHLPQHQMDEVYFLVTEGCPCCGQPMKSEELGLAYGISRSTISRIKNHYYKTNILNLDVREKVELFKKTNARIEEAKRRGAKVGR
jgi:hypothetical protein